MAKIKANHLAIAMMLCLSTASMAAPPDLTNSGVPADALTINLGPTGLRGWVYHVRADTGESRQIQVKAVDAGSPAAGTLAANDVILGANGTGADPVNFTSDARKSLALAIADAEARTPATLKLIRWRAGTTTTVTLTLRTMGAYSATAPYNCPKSAKILEEGLQYIMTSETAGHYSFGTLSLLAGNNSANPNNAARQTRAQTEARALIPSAATRAQLMSDARDASSMVTWQRGHTLIVLAEYFLQTDDTQVLPAIEAYAVNIAKNQSLFGTVGHIFAEKNADGSANGPMGGVYGTVNSTGLPCFFGLLLAKQCGLTNPEIAPAIERSSRFFSYYKGRGAIPYGEHEAFYQMHESNGKCGLAALAFELQANRATEQQFFAKMATAASSERENGHTGAFFNFLWSPLGAAAGGEEAGAAHFSRISWMLDLNRRWNGGFDYDCLNGEGPNGGSQYYDFRMSTAALLVYALPLRQLHITGRGHNPARWLSSTDVAEAAFSDTYNAPSRTTNQVVTDLGNWSPKIQRLAADELAKRTTETTALLPTLNALANDPNGSSRVGACFALGKINNAASAPVLAALLTDPQNHVRFAAAEGMRYMSQSYKIGQLNTILAAAASTATPLLPFNEEDPLHFSHARLAMLLFYSGNAYGPKGVIYGSGINTNPVNRTYLYPAIRAVAANPIGQARGTLTDTYRNLTAADVNALADTLVESIQFRAPSDKMFSSGIRQGGIEALKAKGIAEGVPLSMAFMVDDGRSDSYTSALGVLQNYAGSSTTVRPDPDVTGFCQALLAGSQAAAAQAVLAAIAADTNPVPLTPFKSIQSVTASAATLTLPANQTVLHANATDLAKGDLVYTWRKVHGAGNVSFTPNGTGAAKDATVLFNNVPGKYRFEVKVSDSRGFTEVYQTIDVTLNDTSGGLPPNSPPTSNPQSITVAPASLTPITLTGSDPEGYALVYSVVNPPAHGSLSGTPPNLGYTADADYTGADSFTFEVMDTEGQVSSSSIIIAVDASGIELYAYEPFDYPTGALAGKTGGSGMTASWANGPEGGRAYVYDETTAITPVDTAGGGSQMLSWDGVANNLPTLPSPGSRYVGLEGITSPSGSEFESYRPLAQSAGAMAGADGVLWMSAVFHYPNNSNYGTHVGLALTTDCFRNRGQNLCTTGGYGSNAGNGIGVARGSGAVTSNSYKLNPTFFGSGAITAQSIGPLPSGNRDNIVILKFVFGTTDTVSAWFLSEDLPLSEADFNANAVSTSSTIDENSLNMLTFSQNRGENAVDEIRIGNSFSAVIGVEGTPPDTAPPTLAATGIVDDRNGEPVQPNTVVTYAVTFSEGMNSTTVDATDFDNAGTSAATIGTVTQSLPGIFTVQVTPTTAGTLQLRIPAGAVLTDMAGNPLNTTAAIIDDTSLVVLDPDTTPPTPNPMEWATSPYKISSSAISMTATTASDPSGVEYYFTNITVGDGSHDSGWQDSPVYTDTGLAASTLYSYSVQARDKSVNPNVAAASTAAAATTDPLDINPPPTPTFTTPPTATSPIAITMTASAVVDPEGGAVQYYFTCTTGGGHDSGWQSGLTYVDTGLAPNTQYGYTVKARDSADVPNESPPSAPASATTQSAPSGIWSVDADGNWSDTTKWSAGIVAFGTENTADFTLSLTADHTVTLDSARTIGKITKNDTTDSTSNLTKILTITGSNTLTLDVTSGSPIIENLDPFAFGGAGRLEIGVPIASNDGLTVSGAGFVRLTNNNSSWTGATSVTAGMLDLGGISNANIGGGTGRNITVASGATVRFNVLSNAFLNRLVETTDEIGVMTGTTSNALDLSSSTGATLPGAFISCFATNGAKTELSGMITPGGSAYRLGNLAQSGTLGITQPSLLSGANQLIVGGNRVVIVGAHTFTGDTTIRDGARLGLAGLNTDAAPARNNSLGLQNSALDLGAPSATGQIFFEASTTAGFITGATTSANGGTKSATFGGLKGSRNLYNAFLFTGPGNNTSATTAANITGFTLNPGTGVTVTYSGAIGGFGAGVSGSTGGASTLTKTGDGTQILTGTSTYTGATTINGGTLDLGTTGSIAASTSLILGPAGTLDTSDQTTNYAIPASQPVTFGIDSTGSGSSGKIVADELDISNATVTYDIPAALDDAVYVLATYTASNLSGTFLSAPADPVGYTLTYAYEGNKIALVSGGGPTGFAAWQAANSTGGALDADHDGDGVDNGTEYFLGGTANTTGFTALPGVTNTGGTPSVTWTKAATYPVTVVYGTDFAVETSATLTGWSTAALSGTPNVADTVYISGNNVIYTFPAGAKKFARLKVTGP